MFKKGYLSLILFINIFSAYYQYLVVGFAPGIFSLLSITADIILILALFSYTFKKRIFEAKIWKILLYIALINLAKNFIMNFSKGSVYTGFGFQELFIGLLVFLLLSGPGYYALYNLSSIPKSKKKNKKKN